MGGCAVSFGAGSLWVLAAFVVAQIQGCGGDAPPPKNTAAAVLAGKAKWTYATGGRVLSSPAVADGAVYVGSRDKKLHAVSLGE